MQPHERIIVALDVPDLEAARKLVVDLAPYVGAFKVGKELFVAEGPEILRLIHDAGGKVFLDLKFHDIPNTVGRAVGVAAMHGVWMVNVHASGGPAMLAAAHDAARNVALTKGADPALVIAVTVLTSLDADDLTAVGFAAPPAETALSLAKLAADQGLAGVVASAHEAAAIKAACGPDFLVVSPGIRPAFADIGDQKRVMTPARAVAAGSDYLVIGRPITAAPDPATAAELIAEEIAAG